MTDLSFISDRHYEWDVEDPSGEWQAGGACNLLKDAHAEGMRYLSQYLQDGPHKLIIRERYVRTVEGITYGPSFVMDTQTINLSEGLSAPIPLTLVEIPAGQFLMGSPEQEDGSHANERPQHLVKLESFFMGQTPITQAQWREVAGWKEREGEKWGRELKPNPSHFQHPGEARLLNNEASTDARPVEQVSWEDAMEFCSRLSQRTGRTYTLPSEAQWEYACRAGTTTPFAFGEIITPDLANYDGNHTYGKGPKGAYREQTTPVGMFPPNAWGLQDMHGNVWEWCLDQWGRPGLWHGSYEGAPEDGSAWLKEEGGTRSLRGGAWNFYAAHCRSAYRSRAKPDIAPDSFGFRVVCLP